MGESLRSSHLIIRLKAKSIIIIIISPIWRRLFSRLGCGRRSKTTKARLEVSDATNLGVHLTYLIGKMVKTPTKINTHELKLIHDGNKRNLCSRRRRMSIWRRRSRSMGSIRQSRLHMWPFSGQLCITPPNRFLADGTHGIKRSGGRNGYVHMWEDVCDSWRKYELITCSSVLIDIYRRFYHMWMKMYRKIL